jgi:ribosomal-protein-alanine N-acetyltransferase
MPVFVRFMGRQDLSQVTKIDREAFPNEWPPTNFARELENKMAHYIVAYEVQGTQTEPALKVPEGEKSSGIFERLKNIFSRGQSSGDKPAEEEPLIVGYAGMWIMADEAHITSIASRTDWRHKGIGEILLINLIELARKHKARIVTLEVRVSNQVAQNLYYKFGFDKLGVRKGYYLNDKEDAIIMSTEYIGSPSFDVKFKQVKQAYYRRWGTDNHEIAV